MKMKAKRMPMNERIENKLHQAFHFFDKYFSPFGCLSKKIGFGMIFYLFLQRQVYMKKTLLILFTLIVGSAGLMANGPFGPIEEQKSNNIKLAQNYPNPANVKTYINLDYKGSDVTFKIYDVLGQLVEEIEVIQKTIVLDVSAYPDGIYLYTLEVDGEKMTRRMTVKHDR